MLSPLPLPRFASVAGPQNLPVSNITLPAAFGNNLGAAIFYDGARVQYKSDPATILNFTPSDGTFYYSAAGNDSTGDGSQGNPWKTMNKCQTYLTANPNLATEHIFLYDTIDILNASLNNGFNWSGNTIFTFRPPTRARTWWIAYRSDQQAAATWTETSAGSGCWYSTTAGMARTYNAAFDGAFLDELGGPLPLTGNAAVITNVAACIANPNSFFWDSGAGRIYVHTLNGRKPDTNIFMIDPGYTWHFVNNKVDGKTRIVTPTLLINNQGTAAPVAVTTFRGNTFPNTNQLCVSNMLVYGSSANGMEPWDNAIAYVNNCHSRYSRRDGFNVHSFLNSGTKGQYISTYINNCTSYFQGWTGFFGQTALSTSENAFTGHDWINILITNCNGGESWGPTFAFVGGSLVCCYNCNSGTPNTGDAGTPANGPQALYWHELIAGVDRADGALYLDCCGGDDQGDPNTLLFATTSQGKIYVNRWRGTLNGKTIQGTAGSIMNFAGKPI